MTTPPPWSHSALQAFETCPRQYEQVKILRNFQDQKNDAAFWGDGVHKAGEQFIRMRVSGLGTASLPANMLQYEKYFAHFTDRPGETLAEQQYALDRQLRPTEFFAPNVWCRAIIDVLTLDNTVAFVDDHKTGKRKKDMQQLQIFALQTFYHHPQIDTVHAAYHWMQTYVPESNTWEKDEETFTRSQIPQLWEGLVPKLDRYMRAFHLGVFPPKKSGLCRRHCPDNTCEHWGDTR